MLKKMMFNGCKSNILQNQKQKKNHFKHLVDGKTASDLQSQDSGIGQCPGRVTSHYHLAQDSNPYGWVPLSSCSALLLVLSVGDEAIAFAFIHKSDFHHPSGLIFCQFPNHPLYLSLSSPWFISFFTKITFSHSFCIQLSLQSSGTQTFWPWGPVSWKKISPQTGVGGRDGYRMIQVHYIYCALHYYYYISSISDHQTLDSRGWEPLF